MARLDGMRGILAGREMRCAYCGCPTAAELEHIDPRAKGGKTTFENIVLSCPLCNRRKGTREAEEFLRSEDWKIIPPGLPNSVPEMLRQEFGWEGGEVRTGSKNSRLRIKNNEVFLLVRASKKHPWKELRLGTADDPKVVLPAWDFLTRHQTKAVS